VCQNCGFCYLDSDAGPQEGSCDGVNADSLAEYGRYVLLMFRRERECCGTVMLFRSSGSDFEKVSVPVPDPDNI
jgi:hypothetical protein